MRPERSLTPERCEELVAGGALSAALGVESAAPRVLSLIDKGIPPDDIREVIRNLAAAGVAVEAMCFSDFPTETYREAMETVRFIRGVEDDLSLFILGRFDLTHGSLVAQKPGEFGIKEVWQVAGDELGTGLFFAERQRTKRPDQQEKLETAVTELSGHWRLHRYPWAGALSTAHSMLWYRKHGRDVFRRLGAVPAPAIPGARPQVMGARYDVAQHRGSVRRKRGRHLGRAGPRAPRGGAGSLPDAGRGRAPGQAPHAALPRARRPRAGAGGARPRGPARCPRGLLRRGRTAPLARRKRHQTVKKDGRAVHEPLFLPGRT